MVLEFPFAQCHATNLHKSEQASSFIPVSMSDLNKFVTSGKDFTVIEYKKKLTLLLLSY